MIEPVITIDSPTFVLAETDIDTDQIIPARFLTTTERDGLGEHAFADWRYDANGKPIDDAPLNSDAAKASEILVAGRNFGCGSSREHAPWALLDFGFRAVISTEIADIFRANSLKNGLVPVIVEESLHEQLLASPGARVHIDIDTRTLSLADGTKARFPLDGFSRYCLMQGLDQLGFLLQHETDIAAFEAGR